jgi:hypothetical protein
MSTSNGHRMVWTAREVAFIIGFADYCIHHNCKYQDSVANELRKFSPRATNCNTVLNKLSRILKSYGITNVSSAELRAQGTGRIDITPIPSDVRTELDGWREDWGFPPLGAETALLSDSSMEASEATAERHGGHVSAHMPSFCVR